MNRTKKTAIFFCEEKNCFRSFSYKSNLVNHRNEVHLQLKPFQCTKKYCNIAFTRKSSLKRHLNTVHSTGSHLCPYLDCRKKFNSKIYLKTHIDAVHRHLKPYKCDFCDQIFGHASSRRRHVNAIHMNIKPYKCPLKYCGSKFSQIGNFKNHLQKIHGVDPSQMSITSLTKSRTKVARVARIKKMPLPNITQSKTKKSNIKFNRPPILPPLASIYNLELHRSEDKIDAVESLLQLSQE